VVVVVTALSSVTAASAASWPSASQSVWGNRAQPFETTITTRNVARLQPKWIFRMKGFGGESATPTVADGVVYFPDWNGYLYAVNASTGRAIWTRKISSYDGQPRQDSRDSPLVVGDELILGDSATVAQPAGAHLFAVSRATGRLLWSTQLDSNPAAIVTSSPMALGDEIVVGVASNEEVDAISPKYQCCTFRGAVVALGARTGKILWKTYTVPSNTAAGGDSNAPCASAGPPSGCGYTGAAVWGVPTIDPLTGQVFVGTGNNYTTPDAAAACASADQNANPPIDDSNCTPPDDYFDAILALNLRTGQIEWGHKVEGFDAFTIACAIVQPGVTWCPAPGSPDFDFGSSPNLFLARSPSGHLRTLVGDGQKSGVYWAFDPRTGAVVWDRLVGPGTLFGGIQWGSAYDGRRLYVPESDPDLPGIPSIPYTLCCGGGSVTGGSWAAVDPQTGAFDWQTAVPGGYAAMGPTTEANGVVFGESMDGRASDPDMFALDASTGTILWSFDAGSSVIAGPAVVNGTVYWGAGYGHLGFPGFTGNDKFYAFTVRGR
jgi:polyvinyl alcohol dehydrogenase (cytochrome)